MPMIIQMCNLQQDLVQNVHNHFANNSVLDDDNAAQHKVNIVPKYLTERILGTLIGHYTVQIWTQ